MSLPVASPVAGCTAGPVASPGYLRNRAVPRHFADMALSPCAEFGNGEVGPALGLGHFEGRGWRGFHHHATLCIAAYGF